jgi:Ca2+-binding RTX toxin-like protein
LAKFIGTPEIDFYEGGAEADSIYGGGGGDHLGGNEGDDGIFGEDGDDTLRGGAGSDRLFGDGGDDVLAGDGGDDSLNGGAGADRMEGGDGNDWYLVDNAGDTVFDTSGHDMVHTWITYTISDGIEELWLAYNSSGNMLAINGTGNGGDNKLVGNDAANVLYGMGGNDLFFGEGGADTLVGGMGDDTLNGGAGGDTMVGGMGNDVFQVADPGDLVVEGEGEGHDTVYTGLAVYTLTANVERLFGSGPDGQSLIGNNLNNVIQGAYYTASVLDGGAGNDTLIGGRGNDAFVVDSVGDKVVEDPRGGTDEIRTALATYSLAPIANVENLVGLSDLGQVLEGNALGNALYGRGGADRLIGLGGDDMLAGGAGDDVLEGGLGNDVYIVEGADTVTELAGEGTDEVRTAIGSRSDPAQMYTLAANVEALTGTSATEQGVAANSLDNVVSMGVGGDLVVLDAGGNDLVSGGGGDDFLYWAGAFTNADQADGGLGFDTVGLLGSYVLAFDADDLVSIEKLAVYGSGNAGAPNSYGLTMHDGNVAAGQKMMVVAQSLAPGEAFAFNGTAETDGSFNIRGGQGGDTIAGGAGADTLWGGLGADTLRGGAGNDEFEYRSAAESEGAAADVIMDFAKGDKINLIGIDADGNAANGDTKFAWLGDGAFTGQAGELRVSQHAQYGRAWVVEADTNGDRQADLTIYLVGPAGFLPEKSDFYV